MNLSHAVLGEKPRDEHAQPPGEDAALLALVDVTRRRLATIEKLTVPSTGDHLAQYLIEGVYGVILVVTVVAWALLGFLVWVPLLVRHTTLLAATVFTGSLFRDQIKVAEAKNRVQFAARFYARGFEHFRLFYRQRSAPETPVGLLEPLTALTASQLRVECLWIVAVWSALVFLAIRAV